ncbi:hypothetical protein GCM10023346_37870 [Arthrobacter gyeryongensis]|uniref:DUF7793 domain-containing protein n=2 Tax=Arthrobacter gyeryongensis TaxID=1650592 RepID=A0ABP9SPS7_9MICC
MTWTPAEKQGHPAVQEAYGRTGTIGGNAAAPSGNGTVELRTDGVIHVIWTPKGTIEASDALAAAVALDEVCRGSEHPLLVDMAMLEALSRDARSIFSVLCPSSRIALLGSSPVDRVIAGFFFGVHKPPCPNRFFTSRNEAVRWLAEADGPSR